MAEEHGAELDVVLRDGRATLKIFPVEIWEQIFEHVDDSQDLQNFCRAFPFWEHLLHRTKQTWLFDQIFPHVWSYLTKREILGCRHVCRRWSTAVDSFLENNDYHRPADATGNHLRRRPLIRGLRDIGVLYSPYSLLRMEKMYRLAVTHSRNPIIGRSVYVDWERVPYSYIPFLSKFGRHIWYLRVQCTQREVQPVAFLLRILNYLPHLPNLKKLELFLWEGLSQNSGGTGSGASDSTTDKEQLDSYLRQHPVSHYPDLHTLEVEIMGQNHEKVKDILLTTFSHQIRRLSINRFTLASSHNLPNLTDLSMTADSGDQLKCLVRLESPLTRIAISIIDHVNYPLAWKAIQHFAPSVRVLAIDFPTATSLSDWKRLKLPVFNLPKLKTLALKGCIPPSLNSIAGLRSLQYLHICDLRSAELVALLDMQMVFQEELVQILKYLNQPIEFQRKGCMYESNVWVVFPKLREFTFTSFIRRTPDVERRYRRDHYERWKHIIMGNV